MIACPRCGHPNGEGARYCSNCALELMPLARQGEMRKTVTVMFMDAAGSTGLGERVDPEALRRVMTRYFDEFRQIVERHGGIVEKYIGDAVVAVFGVPVVHEDDALRAVRAAAEIGARLPGLSSDLEGERGLSVSWRTGINTGEVVAGDAADGQRFVSGDAVNVAARLEQAAAPGQVLLGSETYRLVRDTVNAEPIEAITAKGKSQPVGAYLLIDVGGAPIAPARRLDSPMIGRHRQRRLLVDAFDQAVEERACHLFTVLGAAGVGKSRLVAEFLAGLEPGTTVLHGRCLSYGEGITYWPVAEVIREAAGLDDADDDRAIRAKIEALVDDERDRAIVAERIGELIGRFGTASVPEEISWAVRTFIESVAQHGPVVLVLDDLHWAEPMLLDLVDHLADWTRDAPLLLVCLARQELLENRPGWGGGKRYATTLTLEPLSENESGELMSNLLGRVELGTDLGLKITAAAEGNPLYVEEMLGMLIDNGHLVRENGGWSTVGDMGRVAVPPTIQALLAARLDRLSRPERAVIERGAVEGKVFHRGAVAELAPDELRDSIPEHLLSLSRKELVRPDRSDFAGDDAFRFRHLLIRDAAYSAMPKEARADLHERFATWLARMAGDHMAEYEELLGYHLEQAHNYRVELGALDSHTTELGSQAASHLAQAGRRALKRADIQAAAKLLGSALALAPPDMADRSRLAAQLGQALVLKGELRTADAMLAEEIERYRAAGDELGQTRLEISRLASQTTLGELTIKQVIAECERLLAVAERFDDEWAIERATFELARHQFFAGHAQLAEDLLAEQAGRYPAGQAPPLVYQMLLAAIYWGPKPIAAAVRQAELIGEQSESRINEAGTLRVIGGMRAMVGDYETALEMVRESAEIEEALGRMFLAKSTRGQFEGPILRATERYAEAEAIMLTAYEQMTAAGDRAFSATVAGNLADLYVDLNRIDEADRFANAALSGSSEDDVEARAQGLAVIGRVHAARGDFEAAERAGREAVKLAEQTDYLHRRGAVTEHLAAVLSAAGKHDEASQALRRAIDYYDAKGAVAPAIQARRRLEAMNA